MVYTHIIVETVEMLRIQNIINHVKNKTNLIVKWVKCSISFIILLNF